jgi:hypothetical protein
MARSELDTALQMALETQRVGFKDDLGFEILDQASKRDGMSTYRRQTY